MTSTTTRVFPFATLLFFLSGALGLGYELVWIRKSALIVGASQIAMSAVLTAFFLGLALGSRYFASFGRSTRYSSLVVYGLLELGIGLFALAFPWIYTLFDGLYALAWPLVAGSPFGIFAVRFLLVAAMFVVPTFLMGGTLPLLLDALVGSDARIGSRTSLLYGVNILGAVAGVLFTGYWAIPELGYDRTSLVGGSANLAIGLLAIVAFRRVRPTHVEALRPALSRFFPAMACASGMVAVAYQIAWARHATLFNFSTTYLTAVLLAVYLLALAIGSLVLSPLLGRRVAPLTVVVWCQALVPVAAVSCLNAWRLAEYRLTMAMEATASGGMRPLRTFELDREAAGFWSFAGEHADAVFFAPVFQTLLVLFLPVVLMGAVLPALIAAATARHGELREVSGRLVFWNTLGASAGGFGCGYVLLPALGLQGTVLSLGVAQIVLALATMRYAGVHVRLAAVPAAGLVSLVAFGLVSEDVTRSTLRRHLTFGDDPSSIAFEEVIEGPLVTAYVTRRGERIQIGTGTVQMAHADRGVPGQYMAGFMPVLLYPGSGLPKDALGLCMGSGMSSGALLNYPIERLDVVELSGEVRRLALQHMAPHNNGLGTDPRVRIHVEDARHFIERAADDSYDVISMESPPPTSDGAHSLYSLEFFREAERVLRPGGVLMHFMPLYFLTPNDAASVMRTMSEAFPYVFVGRMNLGDMILLGYPSRPRFVPEAIEERGRALQNEWIRRGSAPPGWEAASRFPIGSFVGTAAILVAGPDAVRGVEAPEIYRDDRPLLGYGTGDRWMARRYQGAALTHLSFTVVPRSGFDELAGYFDPPLDRAAIDVLTTERVAALREFNVADPRALAEAERTLAATEDPSRRVDLALSIARVYDASLQKARAYAFVEIALEASRGRTQLVNEAHTEVVRSIVRNRQAVFAERAAAWVDTMRQRHAGSPLFDAARAEVEAFSERR